MVGVLQSLVVLYDQTRGATMALSELGLPGCNRGKVDITALPDSDIREPNSKTSFPFLLGVEYLTPDGRTACHALKCPCTPEAGRALTHRLVKDLSVHPLDIVVFEWSAKTGALKRRTSVDHLFWTHRDQRDLEARNA